MRSLVQAEFACDAVLTFLAHSDVVCWVVCAIENSDSLLEQLLWSRSPHRLTKEPQAVLHCAAAHGCFNAVYQLRKSAARRHALTETRPSRAFCNEGARDSSDYSVSRRVAVMRWVDAFRPYRFPSGVMYEAARQGDLQLVQWLHGTSDYEPSHAVRHAAERGHLEIAQWLLEQASVADHVELLAPFAEGDGVLAWVLTHPGRAVASCFFGTRNGLAPQVRVSDPVSKLYDAVTYAAGEGDIELLTLLKRTEDKCKWRFTGDAVVRAAAYGKLEAVQWLVGQGGVEEYNVKEALNLATQNGQLHVLKWMYATNQVPDSVAQDPHRAVCCRDLETLEWIYDRFPETPCYAPMMETAVATRSWQVAQWLNEKKGLGISTGMLEKFATSCDVELVKWALAKLPTICHLPSEMLMHACESGSVQVVQYLVGNFDAWSEDVMNIAVGRGHLDLAKWLHSTGRPYYECALIPAASNGQFELVEWLLTKSRHAMKYSIESEDDFYQYQDRPDTGGEHAIPPFSSWTRTRKEDAQWRRPYVELFLRHRPEKCLTAHWLGTWATRFGYVEVVQRLIHIGHSSIFTKANLKRILRNTNAGSLVQLYLEAHLEWLDPKIVRWAAKHNQLALLRFIFTRMDPIQDVRFQYRYQMIISIASRYGNVDVLKFAQSQLRSFEDSTIRDPWTDAVTSATAGNHVHILEWLVVNNLFDQHHLSRASRAALHCGHLTTLKWLMALSTCCALSVRDLQRAMERGNVDVARWILQRRPELCASTPKLTLQVATFLKKWKSLPTQQGYIASSNW